MAIVPAGDAIWDPRMMIEVLREPPWSAMRFDVTFAGGVAAALQLFEVAKTFGLDVELTSYGETFRVQATNLGVMLAFGRTSCFEASRPVRRVRVRRDDADPKCGRRGDGGTACRPRPGRRLGRRRDRVGVLGRFSVED